MRDAESTNQRDLVLGGGEQMRRVAWPEHLCWMRIERDDNRRSFRRVRMSGGGGDDGLMPAVHTIENADGKKQWTAQLVQLGDRPQNFHRRSKLKRRACVKHQGVSGSG